MVNKIGILGGTFNPVHNGHIQVALSAMEECALSRIVFLPNGNPAYKSHENMASASDRLNMVKIAVSSYKNFEVSDYEIKRTEPSYTFDTMKYLKRIYDADIFFIIGADSLYDLGKWKNSERLIREINFIVADRDVSKRCDIEKECERINSIGGSVIPLSMPRCDITSTNIREKISGGEEYSEYVPAGVFEYINSHCLYKAYTEDKNDF